MNNNNLIILTAEGKKEKEKRLNEIVNELMPDVRLRIKTAKEQGDLSENAEYHAAREELGKLEGERIEIEEILKRAVVAVNKGDNIQVGVKFTCEIDDESFEFTLVSPAEAKLFEGKISNESPLGSAVVGHCVNDIVTVVPPKGASYQVKITAILGWLKTERRSVF